MRIVVCAMLLLAGPFGLAQGRISAGAGMEGRVQEDVNPELRESKVLPQFFVQYRFLPLAVSIEGGSEERTTSSGALQIKTNSSSVGLWGRYEFLEPLRWSPFAGAGMGAYFDEVTSRFGSAVDVREGQRNFFGLNGGISHSLWRHLLLEGEMRAVLIQDRKDVAFSGIIRIGFVL